MGFLAAMYGLACYVVFLTSFLYAIGFIGDIGVPKSIDTGPTTDIPEAFAINLALLL